MSNKEIIIRKVLNSVELDRILAFWNFKGKRVALAFGTFDTITPVNNRILIEASELADVLLVGLRSDSLVRQIKGEGNLLFKQEQRSYNVAAQMLVSGVFVHNESDPASIVDKIKPVAIACCAHATSAEIAAYQKVEKWGGKLLVVNADQL